MNFFKKFLDIFFPIKCINCGNIDGGYLCKFCKSHIVRYSPECYICRVQGRDWEAHSHCKTEKSLDGIIYLYVYNRLIHELMLSIKYSFQKDKIREIINLIVNSPEFKQYDFSKFEIITFVPISRKRFKWRGFNQAEVIAKYLSKHMGIPKYKIIDKVKTTKAQIELSKEERVENLKDSFALIEDIPVELDFQSILIIDDICTTGSTLEECSHAIKIKYPNVKTYGLCLSRGK